MGEFSRNDIRAVLAEFLGTMFFIIVGTGSVIGAFAFGGDAALLTIAVGHGLGIMVAVAWTAGISGGHINPVVSLAMIVTRNIRPVLGGAYIVAQLAGAVVGSVLVKWSVGAAFEVNLGAHGINSAISSSEGLLMEIILTAFLVLVIYNVAVSKKGWGANAPIAIGFAVLLIHLVAVPFTGASVNPARSFGPALVANEWGDFWVYVVGPAAGALIAAVGWWFWKSLGEDELEESSAN